MKNLFIISLALIIFACDTKPKEVVSENIEPTNSERVKKLYDAFAAADMESVVASFAPNIEWNEAENYIYSDGNPYIGADAIVEGVFQKVGEEWEYWNTANAEFFDVGEDRVLVTGRYQAKNKATGKELDSQFAHFWKLKDTLVISFQQYTDTKQAAEAIVMEAPTEE